MMVCFILYNKFYDTEPLRLPLLYMFDELHRNNPLNYEC